MLYQIYIASVMAAIFCKESVVCGHHVYKAVWTPFVGEILDARREDENSHDSCVVGHLPHEYSRIAWHFLQHGGKISCEITGRRRHGLGLVVPYVYKLLAEDGMVLVW